MVECLLLSESEIKAVRESLKSVGTKFIHKLSQLLQDTQFSEDNFRIKLELKSKLLIINYNNKKYFQELLNFMLLQWLEII